MNMKDKLIENGAKIWEKGDIKRIYLNQDLCFKVGINIQFNEKKHKLFFDLNNNRFDGTSKCFVSALNSYL